MAFVKVGIENENTCHFLFSLYKNASVIAKYQGIYMQCTYAHRHMTRVIFKYSKGLFEKMGIKALIYTR